jgi:hypothetical protein
MYARHNPAVMDASTAAGYLTWAALALGGTPAGHAARRGQSAAKTHQPDPKE